MTKTTDHLTRRFVFVADSGAVRFAEYVEREWPEVTVARDGDEVTLSVSRETLAAVCDVGDWQHEMRGEAGRLEGYPA